MSGMGGRAGCQGPCRCLQQSAAWTGVRPLIARRPPSGHGYSLPQTSGAWQLIQPGAEPVWDRYYGRPRRSREAWSAVRPGTVTGGSCRKRSRLCRTPLPNASLWPSGMLSGFRTPRPDAAVRCPSGGWVARGTARRVGGHWSDAASAGGHERAGWSGDRGVGRGHRSSPGGSVSGPPQR
jgi:hypothetical protein